MNFFSFSQLQTNLVSKSSEETFEIVSEILKKIEREGKLLQLFQTFINDDPSAALLKLANPSDFEVAKYGVLQRSESYFKKK